MGISRVTRNFQVTIPKDVRKAVGMKEGEDIMFIVDGDKISLLKSNEDPVLAAAGIWKDMKETGTEYQKRMRQEWKKRQKRLNW